VEDNHSLLHSPPEKLNGNDSEMDAHQQVDMVVRCKVTVDVHLEDIKEKDELQQTGKDNSVEESVLARVESVNRTKLNKWVRPNV